MRKPSFRVVHLWSCPLICLLAVTLTGACTDAEPDAVPASEAVAPVSYERVQGDVDTLLVAYGAFADLVRGGAMPLAIAAEYERLDTTVAALAASPGEHDLAAVLELSRKAGQLAPQLRTLKRALERSTLDATTQADWLASLGRVQLAARSLDLAIGELVGELDRNRIAEVDVSPALRNGPLAPISASYVLDVGYVDAIDVAYEDGALGIPVYDQTLVRDVERDPARTVMVVKPAAKVQVPDARFAFLASVGSDVWVLPEGQLDAEALSVLWPRISTMEIEPGVFLDDQVQVRFKGVTGPGGFSLFQSPPDEATPPVVLVDSAKAVPGVLTMPARSYKHANWAFASPGVYHIQIDVRGQLAGVRGNPWVTSSTKVLKFVVQP